MEGEEWTVYPDRVKIGKEEETQLCQECFFRKPRSEFGPAANVCNPCKIEMGEDPE
jgi:hypothetical protein